MHSKDELLELILNKPVEYGDYKTSIGDDELDLTELDFSNSTIDGVDFSNADLTGSSFTDAQLSSVNFSNCELKSADFTRANVVECDFTGALVNGTDFSFAKVDYCNFTDADMAGSIFIEADLENTDLSASENLNASRYDETTLWPDPELLPEEFDTSASRDLSTLDDEEESSSEDY